MSQRDELMPPYDVPDQASWTWGFSIADAQRIEAMDEQTRASVERYVRARLPAEKEGDAGWDDYEAGFEDGVEAMNDEISSISTPHVTAAEYRQRKERHKKFLAERTKR